MNAYLSMSRRCAVNLYLLMVGACVEVAGLHPRCFGGEPKWHGSRKGPHKVWGSESNFLRSRRHQRRDIKTLCRREAVGPSPLFSAFGLVAIALLPVAKLREDPVEATLNAFINRICMFGNRAAVASARRACAATSTTRKG